MSERGAGAPAESFDVVVIGAGTSGAGAAAMLAGAGYRVALVEGRPLAAAGARWITDVPPWMFDRAGVARPAPPEKHVDHRVLKMIGGGDRVGVVVPRRPMWGIDTPLLTARLQADALARGVAVFSEAVLCELEHHAGRPSVAVIGQRSANGDEHLRRLHASLFVDASGIDGAVRQRAEALAAACPRPRPDELVSATQQIRVITDRHGAEAFLDRLGALPDEFLTWSGERGGFSTRMVRVAADLGHVDLLTGAVADPDPAAGMRMLEALLAALPWVGAPALAGASLIPVRRPYDRVAAPGVALVGDAACQTFPAHGSGVGAGLVAARILTNAVRDFSDPGSAAATWAYQAAFVRECGAVSAAYDVFRRTIQRLPGASVQRLIDAGLMTSRAATAALDQRMPVIDLAEIGQVARGFFRAPGPAAVFAPCVARMLATHAVYARYPAEPDEARHRRWARCAAVIAGQRRDPG